MWGKRLRRLSLDMPQLKRVFLQRNSDSKYSNCFRHHQQAQRKLRHASAPRRRCKQAKKRAGAAGLRSYLDHALSSSFEGSNRAEVASSRSFGRKGRQHQLGNHRHEAYRVEPRPPKQAPEERKGVGLDPVCEIFTQCFQRSEGGQCFHDLGREGLSERVKTLPNRGKGA